MSLIQKTVSGVLFPVQEKLKGHNTIAVHRQLDKSQWLSMSDMQELQTANLRRFLGRIGDIVPYYKNLFADLQFDPAGVSGPADLQRLPFLDKPTIRSHCESMKAEDARGLKRFNTGGSSGEPLIFYLGNERVSHDVAAKRRATRWWDVDIGDKEIVVWGSPIELGAQDKLRLLRDRLFRTELLSAFEMSEEKLDEFVWRIQRVKPAMLFGYPSSLSLIAQHVLDSGMNMSSAGVKVAFVTSERLYDHQRRLIEQVFGCSVANGYGGRDAGFIAHECPQGSLHLTAEDLIVEIVDDKGTVLPCGESGEIVVTHMYTSEFPFVRYRTGDVGVLASEPCACGRGLSVLARVEGRSTDFVTAMDGTRLHGLALIYVLRDMPEVEMFRIVQESLQHTRVELVVSEDCPNQLDKEIRRQFRQRLGQQVEISVERMEAIPRESSGKFRYVISNV